jgi:hypothetical protein
MSRLLTCALKDANHRFPKGMDLLLPAVRQVDGNGCCMTPCRAAGASKQRACYNFKVGVV